MAEPAVTIQSLFDYGATFVWAVSGGLIAARRGYDIAGVTTVALVSATGGGLLRDGLFLQDGPPALARTSRYMLIVAAAVLLVRLAGQRLDGARLLSPAVHVVDALALGAYAVVGMRLSIDAGLSLPAVMLVGVVNAVGGGVLRDVLMRREPEVFMPGTLMAVAALASTVVYAVLELGLGLSPIACALPTVLTAAIIRAISVRYDLRTRATPGFDAEP